MITIESEVFVEGITGQEIFDFLLGATDESYRNWWPGTHLRLHALERHENHIGDVFYMDEFIRGRRVRMKGVVLEAERGRRIVWRFERWRILLPVRLTLELAARDGGVALRHTIRAGFGGPGRVLDPLFRIYFSPSSPALWTNTSVPSSRCFATDWPSRRRPAGLRRRRTLAIHAQEDRPSFLPLLVRASRTEEEVEMEASTAGGTSAGPVPRRGHQRRAPRLRCGLLRAPRVLRPRRHVG